MISKSRNGGIVTHHYKSMTYDTVKKLPIVIKDETNRITVSLVRKTYTYEGKKNGSAIAVFEIVV